MKFIKSLFKSGLEIENSKTARKFIFITVVYCWIILSFAYSEFIFFILLLPFLFWGHYYSYYHREKSPKHLRKILSWLLFLSVIFFVVDAQIVFITALSPQGKLVMLLLTVTSFELQYRRYLTNTLLLCFFVMYIAAYTQYSITFLLPFLGYLFLCTVSLTAIHFSKKNIPFIFSFCFKPFSHLLLPAILIFYFLPRFPFMPISFPMSMRLPLSRASASPALFPLITVTALGQFNDIPIMDLRLRGIPSEKILMLVRAPYPYYLKAFSLTNYDGKIWKGEKPTIILRKKMPPYILYPLIKGKIITQTIFFKDFSTETLLSYPLPQALFLPAEEIKVGNDRTVNFSPPMGNGGMYTVISKVPEYSKKILQTTAGEIPYNELSSSLQLPPVSKKLLILTREILKNKNTIYDKVVAIENYLKQNYIYDLGVPAQISKEDSVDWFLFKTKRGYCEHFASAMTVMLRIAGVPSRIAVGFGMGEYNPYSGLFVIRGADAHAWVEVYFPKIGFVPFDPTPSFSSPFAAPSYFLTAGLGYQVLSQGINFIFSKVPLPILIVIPIVILIFSLIKFLQIKKTTSQKINLKYLYLQLCEMLYKKGFAKRQIYETPFQYQNKLNLPEEEKEQFSLLTKNFVESFYGREDEKKSENIVLNYLKKIKTTKLN